MEYRETLEGHKGTETEEFNDEVWYTVFEEIHFDRLALMTLLGVLHLAMMHPQLPASTCEHVATLGREILNILIKRGMKAPLDVYKAYYDAFLT